MQEQTLPNDIEALIALAESGSATIRRVVSIAYEAGRLDGMLTIAKVGSKSPAVGIEVAA